jgi:hypothetical protein
MKQSLMVTGLLDKDTLNVIYLYGGKNQRVSLGLQIYCQLSSYSPVRKRQSIVTHMLKADWPERRVVPFTRRRLGHFSESNYKPLYMVGHGDVVDFFRLLWKIGQQIKWDFKDFVPEWLFTFWKLLVPDDLHDIWYIAVTALKHCVTQKSLFPTNCTIFDLAATCFCYKT